MKIKTKGNLHLVANASFSLSGNVDFFEGLLEKQTATISNHYDDTLEAARRIQDNPDLSDQGKKKQLADLYGRHVDFMKSIADNQEVKNLETRKAEVAAKLKQSLQPEVEKMDSARAEMRAQEIRRWFQTIDPVHREQTYLEAVSRGDIELCRAIEDAPSFYKFVPDSLKAEGQRRRQFAINPDDARFISDVSTLNSTIQANIARADRELEDLKKVAWQVYPEKYDALVMQAHGTE